MSFKRAAAYARFSSDRQNELSNDDQLEVIYDYARKNGYRIVKTYSDKAQSGFLGPERRDGLRRLLEEAKKYDFQYILVWKFNRLARDRRITQNLRKEFKDLGLEIISITQNLPSGSSRILVESFYDGVAEWYSWNLAENVMRGMIASVKRGGLAGRSCPFGYNPERDASQRRYFKINKEEAEAVKEIYEKYFKGEGLSHIAEWLNRKGFKTKRGNKFSPDTVYWMLRNKIYKGVIEFNNKGKKGGEKNPFKEVIRIEHPELAIVPSELWENVQKIRRANQGRRSSRIYLLKGLIRCSKCGHYATRSTRGHNKKTRQYNLDPGKNYYCNWCKKNLGYSGMVGEKKMNLIVLDFVLSVFNEAENNIESFTQKVNEKLREKKRELEIPGLLDERAKIEQRINNITEAIEQGKAQRILLERLDNLDTQKQEIMKKIRDARIAEREFREIKPKEIQEDFAKWRYMLLEDVEQAHELLKKLISIKMDFDKKVAEITIFNTVTEVAVP